MAQSFPDFTQLPLGEPGAGADLGAWAKLAGDSANVMWETPEGIPVKPLHTAADTAGLDFLDDYPGIAPFGRGPYPDHVHQPAVDDPPVRRFLHRRRLQRLLPPQPRCRSERPLRRLRPRHPPWL